MLPYFYSANIDDQLQVMDSDASRHIVQVLRLKEGDRVLLTDGKGTTAEGEITEAHKRRCSIKIVGKDNTPKPSKQLTIGISLIKNSSRFEWFLEKATELGTAEIIPMVCERTERQKFRPDRFENILRSAMLQSMQAWMPILHEPRSFNDIITHAAHDQRFIAHCAEDDKQSLIASFDHMFSRHMILIGPEGDFTPTEISAAKQNGFIPVFLGSTRLRTETAGIYAAVVATE